MLENGRVEIGPPKGAIVSQFKVKEGKAEYPLIRFPWYDPEWFPWMKEGIFVRLYEGT